MKVTLKLYASLGAFLPPGADRNTIQLDMPRSARCSPATKSRAPIAT
jgi:hypothetical protein